MTVCGGGANGHTPAGAHTAPESMRPAVGSISVDEISGPGCAGGACRELNSEDTQRRHAVQRGKEKMRSKKRQSRVAVKNDDEGSQEKQRNSGSEGRRQGDTLKFGKAAQLQQYG